MSVVFSFKMLITMLIVATTSSSFHVNAMAKKGAYHMKSTGHIPAFMWSSSNDYKELKTQIALNLFDTSSTMSFVLSIKECHLIPDEIIISLMKELFMGSYHNAQYAFLGALVKASEQGDNHIVRIICAVFPNLSLKGVIH